MKEKIIWISVFMVILLLGLSTYRFWWPYFQTSKTTTSSAKKKERKILYWVAPMDPTYRRDKPGKSPMGMDLIPIYADQQIREQGIVKILPQMVNNLGIRTTIVKKRTLPRIIDTVGYVTANEDRIEHVHTYTSGWIRKLYVNKTGEVVKEDQVLAELYSPTLNNAQEEYLLALKIKHPNLIRAGEKKLLTLGVSQQQIKQLKKTRKVMALIQLHANQSGVISELNIREGMFVKPETNLMTIEDLSPIWIIAEVFERQANWVKEKQAALATFSYLPGKTWQGQVDYVYPQLDPKTHTLRVRLIFPNPDLLLKPQMYANIKIMAKPLKNVLAIPREALIRTGQGDRVILALGDGKFRAQAVSIGIESGSWVAVLSGLKAGDKIVTSAQFLIDSESNLKASLNRMSPSDHPHSSNQHSQSSIQQWIGMGIVKSVDLDKREIVLDHQPIPAINMPAMTMGFYVLPSINLNTIKPRQEIHFVLIKNKDNQYHITKIQIIKNNKGHAYHDN